MGMNKEIMLTGNLGHAPVGKYTPSGKFICEFSIAVTSGWGDNKHTDWFKCVAWEKKGEILNEWLHKGSKIQVRGDFKIDTWLSKDSGEAKAGLVVTVDAWQFLSPKNSEQSEDNPYDGNEEEGE